MGGCYALCTRGKLRKEFEVFFAVRFKHHFAGDITELVRNDLGGKLSTLERPLENCPECLAQVRAHVIFTAPASDHLHFETFLSSPIMEELRSTFNKSAQETLDHIKAKGLAFPDLQKREIFAGIVTGLELEVDQLKTEHDRDRLARIVADANLHSAQRSPVNGPEPYKRAITEDEVMAMSDRANRENVTIDQLTPESHAEQHIIPAYVRTMQYEGQQLRVQQDDHEEVIRHSYRELKDLSVEDFAQTHDDRGRTRGEFHKGDLSAEFSRRR